MRRLQTIGFLESFQRWRILRRILQTRPIHTQPVSEKPGACEVHILTWDGDWRMALWAAKSFYHFAGIDWPLVWHEGGSLRHAARAELGRHFPQSLVLTQDEADNLVEGELKRGGFLRCLEARRRSFMLLKMIDCLVLSRAERLLQLDSDILFFDRPEEILSAVAARTPVNLFNRDGKNWYTVSPQAAKKRYGITLIEKINAGLGLVRRESLPLAMLEEFLADPDILADPWLTEQTLQALCASKVGGKHLPDTYLVSMEPGLATADGRPLVAKHYPGFYRPYFYWEGLTNLIRQGFLDPAGGIGERGPGLFR
ncbi:MAG TPA: hypothetical protein VH592_12570 [Gemmataceae bacterium]